MRTNGIKEILISLCYYSSSQYMKLKYVVDLRQVHVSPEMGWSPET